MFNKAWVKKPITIILAATVTVALAVSAFAAPVISASAAPMLIFSGVTITSNSTSGTVQGFLDVSVKNIENVGAGFTLEYNTDYVALSRVSDNGTSFTPMDEISALQGNPVFFNLNKDAFKQSDVNVTSSRESGGAANYEALTLDFSIKNTAEESSYIKEKAITNINPDGTNMTTKVLDALGKTVLLGSISFQIKDPAAFAKLSSTDLSKIFRIQRTDTGENLFQISEVDVTSYPPVVFYDQSKNLDYVFNVENTMISVTLDVPSMSVTADEIYDKESPDDLLKWINTYMNAVTVRYADGTAVADTVTWGDASKEYSMTGDYNVKGGSYTFTQKYNDKFSVTARLEVKPVNIAGYVTTDAFIAYDADSVPQDISDEAMKLPALAQVIFDKFIANGANYTVTLDGSSWHQTSGPALSGGTADFFTDKANGKYTFAATANTGGLPSWVTVGSMTEASVVRGIGPQTEAPRSENINASVSDDGVLTVVVSCGTSELADINFIVRMPGGLVIDPDAVTSAGGTYTLALNDNDGTAANGTATIKIKAGNKDDAMQLMLSQYINLGSRGGSFGLAAEASGELQSDFTPFSFDPRNNYYIAPASGGSDYEFDYSGAKATLFPFDETETDGPPLTIILPSTDAVRTVYSGTQGTEPGSLKTITVDSWTLESGELKAGETVVYKGVLADTSYTDYGSVVNKDDSITVTIKLTVSEAPEENEQIEDITDFVFNKKQEGYGAASLQTAEFNVKNIGNIDITGAHVTFELENDYFTVSGNLPYTLAQGASESIKITPKAGLPVGRYEQIVTIGSNRKAVLDKFKVTFEVTDKPVYNIRLTPSIPGAGTLTSDNGYAYCIGEDVTIKAEANEDYIFRRWEVTNDSGITVSFSPDANATTAAFIMPDVSGEPNETLEIQAVFDETLAARLRITDLIVMDDDDNNTQHNLLGSSTLKKVTFDPKVKDYAVITGNTSERNKAWFMLKSDDPSVTVSVSVTTRSGISGTESAPVAVSSTADTAASPGAFNTDAFDIAAMPVINKLIITLTANEGGESASRIYTVDIYRKPKADDMVSFNYGNSPYGLIERDSSITDKAAAKKAFDDAKCSFKGSAAPEGAAADLSYHADAWGLSSEAYNYDKDEYALFVYNGYSFKDPGIRSVTNSVGDTVEPADITRKVTLLELTAENPSNLINDMREVTEATYTLPADVSESVKILDKRVRPGVYSIDYSFKDFDGSTVTVSKPLIVLYRRGDVDLSNMTERNDALYIERRFRVQLPYGNIQGFEAGSMLALYRIVDVNNDRNINIGDANAIKYSTETMSEFYPNDWEDIKQQGEPEIEEGGAR